MDKTQIEALNCRLEKLEKQDAQNLVTLVEILSNATLFGKMKKTNCPHAKESQCSLFFLKNSTECKFPIATECRIEECASQFQHSHLEISNLTCTFCPQWQKSQYIEISNNQNSSRRKKQRQEKQ